MIRERRAIAVAGLLLASTFIASAFAGKADVIDVKIKREESGTFRFEVTVKHADTGWSHYADRWDVVGPDGTVLGKRTLYHPHVDEQPFTRSLTGVRIPPAVKSVTVRAHDNADGLGGKKMTVEVPHPQN